MGSGNDEEIITAVVVVTSTTTPRPSTTEKPSPPCVGPDCGSSSKLRLTPNGGDTGSTRTPNGGQGSGTGSAGSGLPYDVESQKGSGNGGFNGQHSITDYDEDSTAEPGKQTDKGGSGINLGLILGVLGSVLLAVIVLAIAFCKLRSRDEGTYKVDETQNFSALQSKKTQGNGAMASGSESGGGKRGKKKDVKEWKHQQNNPNVIQNDQLYKAHLRKSNVAVAHWQDYKLQTQTVNIQK
ncbi:neurexin [Plakobranchus ocellatus]|uniref:Neurexin n=1 Tax=Plakobranchus ocellatus TaxID=259542 RepID=A0AAV4CUN4_9GAST|nr:neurexin [Plakobranchus ocellatus]